MPKSESYGTRGESKMYGIFIVLNGKPGMPLYGFMVAVLAKRRILHRLVAEDFSSNVNGNDFLSQRRQ